MPNTNNWLGNNRLSPVNTERRAVLAWRRINHKPSSVTFYDPDTEAAIAAGAQTVRLEYDNRGDISTNMVEGMSPKRDLVIFGVKDHPSVADTVIKEGYAFRFGGLNYKVIDVIPVPGEVQATAERYDGS